jgi:hypothetical protein
MVKDPMIHFVDVMEQTRNDSCHLRVAFETKSHHQQQNGLPRLVMLGRLVPVSK